MYLAIDIGGTKTLAAIFDSQGNIVNQKKIPTDHNYNNFISNLEKIVAEISTDAFIAGAIGTRGLVDRVKGVLVADDVLPWRNVNLVEDLKNTFNCKFLLENDAKASGLAEAAELEEYRKVLYFTVSTGIGAAYTKDGKLPIELQDIEMGKIPLLYEDRVQAWEDFASGKAILKIYGKKASEIGDPKIWKEIGERLGYGVAICCCLLQPEAVVFGGGAGRYAEKFIPSVKNYLETNLGSDVRRPKVLMPAKYPDECVVRGCFILLNQHGLVQ